MLKSHKKSILETLGRGPIHPFPARMAPGIALDVLGESRTQLRVLDPMTGSGTSLAVAHAKGHLAFGVDLDPLAVLLASVWTCPVAAEKANEIAQETLVLAKSIFRTLTYGEAYPIGCDAETKQFIRYWFDDYARRQLVALANAIHQVEDEPCKSVLWAAYSRLIISKRSGASLAMDLSHSRPHRVFARAPLKPFNGFVSAVNRVVMNCPQIGDDQFGPAVVVKQGDARKLDIKSNTIDLILTSPPYLNAIDYMRCSKFSLVWMGYTISKLRHIRGESVGTGASSKEAVEASWVRSMIKQLGLKPALSSRDNRMLSQYVWDMGGALSEASRVLRRGARAVYVVGDSTIRGTFVRNTAILTAVAKEYGLKLQSKHSRVLPDNRRYLPPPKRNSSEALDTRMRRELILEFCKP